MIIPILTINNYIHIQIYIYIYIDGNTDPQIMQHLHEVIKLKKQTLGNVIYYQFYLNITYHHLLIMIITSHHHHLYKHQYTYLIYVFRWLYISRKYCFAIINESTYDFNWRIVQGLFPCLYGGRGYGNR